MKKLLLLLALTISVQGAAIAGTEKSRTLTEQEAAEVRNLTQRLEMIRDMDKETLSNAERKELRREVRDIKEQLKAVGGGVYISAAALIIIILLLILLL